MVCGWAGRWVVGRKPRGKGDMSVHIVHAADSLCCTAKLTEFCKSNYTSIEKDYPTGWSKNIRMATTVYWASTRVTGASSVYRIVHDLYNISGRNALILQRKIWPVKILENSYRGHHGDQGQDGDAISDQGLPSPCFILLPVSESQNLDPEHT